MQDLDEEERAVISIFAPLDLQGDDDHDHNYTHNPVLSEGTSLDTPLRGHQNSDNAGANVEVNSGAQSTAKSERQRLDSKLAQAESAFLGNKNVQRPNVSLRSLAREYSKSKVPEAPISTDTNVVENYVNDLVQRTVNDSINTASPNMIGHMTSSLPYFMRPLSRLVTTLNQNAVKTETAKSVTFLEREAVAQLHQQIFQNDEAFYKKWAQNPTQALGAFTSGGTLANITALWAARNNALPSGVIDGRNFGGVEKEGLHAALEAYGYKGAVIIGSQLLHYSMGKAADVLGIGTAGLAPIGYDESYRVKVDELEKAVLQYKGMGYCIIAIIGIAGATETGSVDPLDSLARISNKYGVHFHVDAAWGGPCVFSRKKRLLLSGIEKADTVTLDGHKQLYMPMGCGLCFFRDPGMSQRVEKSAAYIIRKDSYDLGKFTLEGSRPANAVYLHSNLNILGIRGYEILVDRSVRMTRFLAEQIIRSPEFELLTDPMTNILLYRCLPKVYRSYVVNGEAVKVFTAQDNEAIDALNVELQTRQALGGRTFVSRTSVLSPKLCHAGCRIVALRVVIANPLTYEADLKRVLADQREIIQQIETGVARQKSMADVFSSQTWDESPLMRSRADSVASGSVTGFDMESIDPEFAEREKRAEKAYKQWEDYWERMPKEVKMILKNDKVKFLQTLVAPENGITDEEGIFHNMGVDSPLTLPRENNEKEETVDGSSKGTCSEQQSCCTQESASLAQE